MREQLAAFRRRLQQHHGDSNRVLEQLSSIQQTLQTVQSSSNELRHELANMQQKNQHDSSGLASSSDWHRDVQQDEEGRSTNRQLVTWTDVESRLLQLYESLSVRMAAKLEVKQEELRRWCSSQLGSVSPHIGSTQSPSVKASELATKPLPQDSVAKFTSHPNVERHDGRHGRSRSLDQAVASKNQDLASHIPRICRPHGSPSRANDMSHASILENVQELRRQHTSKDACQQLPLVAAPELDALRSPCCSRLKAHNSHYSPSTQPGGSHDDLDSAAHELSASSLVQDASISTSTIDQLHVGSTRKSGQLSLIDSSLGDSQMSARQPVHQGRSPGSRWSSPGSINSLTRPTLVGHGHGHPNSWCESSLVIAALEERAAAASTEATEMVTWARHTWPEQLQQLMAQVEESSACVAIADAAEREAAVAQAAASSAAAHAEDVQGFAELTEAALAASVDAKASVEANQRCRDDEGKTAHLCLEARVDAVEVAQRFSSQEWHTELDELRSRQMLLGATTREPAWAAQIREVEDNLKSLLAAQAEDSAAAFKWLASLLAEAPLPGVTSFMTDPAVAAATMPGG